MVDAGAESTSIDTAVLEAIGSERRKKDLQFQLANGQIVTRSVGYAVLRVDVAAGPIVSAATVAQSLTLPGPGGTPDSSGRALEHAQQASR